MSEVLKCIGGPNHGETVRLLAGELYRVMHKDKPVERQRFSALTTMGAYTGFERTTYTRRRIRTGDDSCVDFLAPEDWSDHQAMERALSA